MKKFITTKLHASPVKENLHHEADPEEQPTSEEESAHSSVTTIAGGNIVEPKSAPSLSPAPVVVATTTTVAVTAMTLNSVPGAGAKRLQLHHQQQQQQKQQSSDGGGGTAVELPPTLIQPKEPQQSKVQPQHAIITISKPKPPQPPVMSSSTSTAAQVKMCGYLKKKRNMGGWRKMYFILQNQLLLSYSSKDDYEKKLAPFKDIINLVPGTVIIPTTGPRFTIETNSKVLYTFRCDDHKSCSEWITALLDSLKGDGGGGIGGDKRYSRGSLHGASNLQHHLTHRSLSSLSSSSSSASSTGSATCHYATDDPSKMTITSIRRLQQHNMPHLPLNAGSGGQTGSRQETHRRQQHTQQQQASLSAPNLFYGFGSSIIGSSSSSSTGGGSNSNHVKVGKLVQLPIASGTARLLERGGANNGQKKYKILTINEVDDDGENDEKPATTTTTATVAKAVAVARDISNGNISRGDPGIKVTTKTSQSSGSDKNNNNNNLKEGPDAGEREDKGKHVKSSRSVDSRPGGELKQYGEGKVTTALANNFRLHTDRAKMHQSVEVCRINSMFSDGGRLQPTTTTTTATPVGRGQNISSNGGPSFAASTGDLRRFGTGSSDGSVRVNNNRGTTGGSATDLRSVTTRIGGGRPDLLLPVMMMESKPLTDINHNNLTKWSAESITIALTENGFTLGSGAGSVGARSVGSTDTLYRKVKSDSSTVSPTNCVRSNSHCSDLNKSSQMYSSRTELNRSPVRQQGCRSPPKRSASSDRAGVGGEYSLRSEPIYAVVDMNLKKARRLHQFSYGVRDADLVGTQYAPMQPSEHNIKVEMIRDLETGRLKERTNIDCPTSLASGSGPQTSSNDYEELSDLTIENFASFGDDLDNANDDENIYEPINIPEHSSNHSSPQPTATGSSQMNNLWRNLKKMNINQLIKRPGSQPEAAHLPNQREGDIEGETVPQKGSTFSELSKKFDHHRRSIKNRMRVLVDRHGQQPAATGPTNDTTSSKLLTQSDEKLRKTSDSRPLFSTFGRNKKSRKSLSFDDFVPRKKHHPQHLDGVVVGVICKTDKVNDELHQELKRQLSKRSDSSDGSSSSNSGQENKNSIEL
ncbi:uncharacterized protein LOC131426170 isoform X2 [Malaya genurostris]|uniref:uncharacterized protein LOC131426170 isoform X2 n=1 Tax=Malaya genurostris TaxID=325434 RepID=UPI0026F3D1FF|nr:uncharacterized protein LOC131426170 isoform X2 [Malaya genurostris]